MARSLLMVTWVVVEEISWDVVLQKLLEEFSGAEKVSTACFKGSWTNAQLETHFYPDRMQLNNPRPVAVFYLNR